MKGYFNSQFKRIEENLEGQKINVGEIFNIKNEKTILKIGITEILKELFIEQGKEHLLLIGGSDYNYTSNAEQLIKKRADFMSDKINDTTYEKIQKELSASTLANETRQELIDRLSSKYDEFSIGRAETISRTETHYILQNATLDASKENGNSMKTWIWSPGVNGGVRDSHLSMDGEEIPINDSFRLPSGASGLVPGATGDGGEDINCQCTMI